MDNILIAYYSYSNSNNTKNLAIMIYKKVGGTLYEIQPLKAYSSSYNEVVDQAKNEIRRGYLPKLKNTIGSLDKYTTIFVGSPNWWSTIAPPVATFLSEYDLSGKTIVPFCTHGGGGQGRVLKDICRLCPDSKVLNLFDIYGGYVENDQFRVLTWLRKIGMIQ